MKNTNLNKIRTATQIIVFAVVFLMGLNNFFNETSGSIFPLSSTHNLCPFGGLETTYTLITTGKFLPKVHSSALVLFVIGIVVVVLFGSIFCGFICPFGSIQEWIGKLGKKLFPKKYNKIIPDKIDKLLRFCRYIVLGKILIETAMVGKLIFETHDPYYAMMNFFSGEVLPLAFVFLVITIVLSLFIERPFCKYACPYGGVLDLVSRFAIFKVRRNKSTCISCKKCDKVCPMNIPISTFDTATGHQCISCYKCVSDECCPVKDTLIISTKSAIKGDLSQKNPKKEGVTQ